MRPEREHLADVRVRRPRLGVQVVAVVPDHHQAEPGDRGEHGGPGPGHHPDLAARDREPPAVPLGRAEARREAHVLAGAERAGQRGVDQVQVPGVGHDDQRPPPSGRGGGRGPGDLVRPVRAGQRGPGCARRAALGQRGEKRGAGRIPGPRSRVRGLRVLSSQALRRCRGLDGGMPRRDGQPQHVGQRAAVPVGHRPGQLENAGGQHRLGRHHPLQERELALVLAGLGPLQQVTAGQPAREPHPDPAAWHRVLGERLRHQVVEGPVQVRQRHVHGHPRDRQVTRGDLRAPPRRTRHGSVLPDPAGRTVGLRPPFGCFQRASSTRRPSAARRCGRCAPRRSRAPRGRSARTPQSASRWAGAGPGPG